MSGAQNTLASFVPRLARELFLTGDGPPTSPSSQPIHGCVLFADITGFTTLVERLSGEGEQGAERVQGILSQYFGPLTQLIYAEGGEILKFPGDAALALWRAADQANLGDAVTACARAARKVQERLDRLPVGDGLELRMRIAVAAGPMWASCVGGEAGRWELVVSGAPIEQLETLLAQTAPGDIKLSVEAEELAAQGTPTAQRAPEEVVSELGIRAFVPRSVQARLEAGQGDWLSEFRRVTVAFVNVADLSHGDADPLDRLQTLVTTVQRAVVRYGGSVNQVIDDEKGVTVVVGFGVALHVHEDDPTRTLLAAIEISEVLDPIGLDARIGITTERIFIGYRGHPLRSEYALIGDGVNVAARLMKHSDGILCDVTTRSSARGKVLFESLDPLQVKGRTELVQVFRPKTVRAADVGQPLSSIGRDHERQLLIDRLAELETGRRGGAVLIEGDAGIGKTRLLQDMLEGAQARAVRVLRGAGDAIEQRQTYRAWRPVVAAILGPGCDADPELLVQRLEHLLGPTEARRSALLNAVLPLQLPELDTGIDAGDRAAATRNLLLALLRGAAEQTPLLIVLEDGHWMDSASWDLAEAAARRIDGLLLVVTIRPMITTSREIERLRAETSTELISLDTLGPEGSLALVGRILDADSIPHEIASLSYERAEGHPFYTEQFALALRDQGHLRVQDGQCRLTAESNDLGSLQIPDTVAGVVTARIDQLTPETQLTMKVASVLGRSFDEHTLLAVHPLESATDRLADQIDAMCRLGLVRPTADGFQFRHALIGDTAYDLLPFAQRQALHESVAQVIEERSDNQLGAVYPLLAHHYERANVLPKAMQYLELAGEQAALQDFANLEATQYFERLLTIDQAAAPAADTDVDLPTFAGPGGSPLTESALRHARWERLLADAQLNLGDYQSGIPHMERCLNLVGLPVPETSKSIKRAILRGITGLVLRPPPSVEPTDLSPHSHAAALEAVAASERYTRAYYTLDATKGMVTSFRALRAAQSLGPSRELCLIYSMMANVAATCLRPKRADQFADRAMAIADLTEEPYCRAVALGRSRYYRMAHADWDCMPGFEEACEILDGMGAMSEWEPAISAVCRIELRRGNYAESIALAEQLIDRTHPSKAPKESWGWLLLADNHLHLGNLDQAIEHAETTIRLADEYEQPEFPGRFHARGILISAHLQLGDNDAAIANLEPALDAMTSGGYTAYLAESAFRGVVDGLRAVDETFAGATRDAALKRTLRFAGFMGRARRVTRPMALELKAQIDHDRGRRPRRGKRALRKSIALADEVGLPADAARARVTLASLLPERNDERAVLAAEAAQIFDRLGATTQLQRLEASL